MKNIWEKITFVLKKHSGLIFRMLICNIILLTGLILWKVSIKATALFATFVLFNFILYNIWNAATNSNISTFAINFMELKNSSKILKISVASMAILSWLTTAGGLQEFVFPGEYLKALLASFAIQAILLVMSLMYCQLYTWIKTWDAKRFGKIILYAITALLIVSMIWSSLFSYVFLANGIYGERRCRDENIILEEFLVEQTSYLQNENEKYGESCKQSLKSTLDSVNKLLKDQQSKEETKQQEIILNYIKNVALPKLQKKSPTEEESQEESQDKSIIFDEAAAEQLYNDNGRRKSAELDGLKLQFNTWYEKYNQYCQTYADGLSSVLSLSADKLDDATLFSKVETQNWSDPFGDLGIDDTIKEIENYEGYLYNKELAGYKGALISDLNTLDAKINNLKSIYENINSELEKYKAISTDMESGSLQLSKVAGIMVGNDITNTDINNLLADLEEKIDLTTEEDSQTLDVQTIDNLSNLIEYLGNYQKYLKIKKDLDVFMNEDLAQTYIITASASADSQTIEELTPVHSIIYLNEKQWREIRKEDFAQFIRLLKMLPEDIAAPIDAPSASDINTNNPEPSETETETIPKKEEVLNTAYILNRDLLEDITAMEKAINYFKYDFSGMAILAAFLAVFFDLGSFLAGCLFFAMKSYKKNLPPDKSN